MGSRGHSGDPVPLRAAEVGLPAQRERPLRLLQFGEGNFLRCFIGWMVDCANQAGVLDAGIAVIQPIPEGKVELLRQQDCLYTVILKGLADGELHTEQRLVSAVQQTIDPYRDWQGFLRLAANPELRWVVSNTTEAGITYQSCPAPVDDCPQSFPAKLTAFLYRRFLDFDGAADKRLLMLPCELNQDNGDTLREIVLAHAGDWELPQRFRSWIEGEGIFFNTLVDRVVPGYPRDEAGQLERELGYRDRLLVVGERFHTWIIEDPYGLTGALALESAGLSVVRVAELAPYRTRKVRILNGAHTGMTPMALLAGLQTVQQVVEHEVLGALLRRMLLDEILPHLPLGEDQKRSYAEDVLDRFANPAIRHYLQDISLNSTAKFNVRVLPSIIAYADARGSLPPLLCLSLAALICFYRACAEPERADRPMRDSQEVVQLFAGAWAGFELDGDYLHLTETVLPACVKQQEPPAGLAAAVAGLLERIVREGIVAVAVAVMPCSE